MKIIEEVMRLAFIIREMNEEQLVLLLFQGELTVSELVKSRKAIKLYLKEPPRWKVLVDLQNVSNALRTADIHEFVSSHHKTFTVSLRIALIVNPRDWNYAIFAENVANNNGIRMRAFKSSAQAKQWLAAG
jgi:hypothetical protein